ncbi:MAG: hypothetical protein IJH07_01060 [Ruminococcus sp.]|nr:hypothetical protein [Ruminococcus sp.]
MKTIKELASMGERVYVYLKDKETAQRFLRDAEAEGFTFGDGVHPTERHWSDLYAIHSDGTLNYVDVIGHIEYGSSADSVVRINYSQLLQQA